MCSGGTNATRATDIVAPGTAGESDVLLTSGVVLLGAGETSGLIVVPSFEDDADEGNESFTLALSAGANAELSSTTALGTVVDNDPPPTFVLTPVEVAEDSQDVAINLLSGLNDSNLASLANYSFSMASNSNAQVVQATITGTSLTLHFPDDANGQASIEVRAGDGLGQVLQGRLAVSVTPDNDGVLVLDNDAEVNVDQNSGVIVLSLSRFVRDPDGSGLTYGIVSNSNPALVSPVTEDGQLRLVNGQRA
jgi:hypothetical protein